MQLEALLDDSPDIKQILNLVQFGISVFDNRYKLVACNDLYLKLLNFPKNFGLSGTPLEEFYRYNAQRGEYGPRDAELLVAERMALVRKGEAHKFERERPNGQVILIQGAPLPSGGFMSTYIDVTDTRQEINKLKGQTKEQYEILKLSLDSLPHGITMFDKDLNLKVCNDKFIELLDFPEEFGLPGTRFESMVRYNIARGEYGEGETENLVNEILNRTRQFKPHQFLRTRPDGKVLEITGKPVDQGFVTTYRDVTDEQEKLKTLHEDKSELKAQVKSSLENFEATRDFLQIVLDTIPIRVFWKDLDGTYQGANKGYLEDREAYTLTELIGKTDYDIFNEEQAQIYADQDKEIVKGQGNSLSIEETVTDEDGRVAWINTYKVPMRDKNNKIIGLLGTYEDITLRIEAENKIKALNEDLESRVEERTQELRATTHDLGNALQSIQATQIELIEAEKMSSLGGLVSGVAHEVNTPIGVSVTAASLLDDNLKELKQKFEENSLKKSDFVEFFESSLENSLITLNNLERAAKLIGSFKQVAIDQSSEDVREFNVSEYLDEVVLNLNPKIKKSKININLHVDPDLRIKSVPGSIAQIFTNLIMNSLIHAYDKGSKGNIKISCDDDYPYLNILFSDDGKGMAPKILEKVFEPFFTTRRGQGGSGLGMNIVYNLVTQRLKGKIKCISAENKGTQFLICLPQDLDLKNSNEGQG